MKRLVVCCDGTWNKPDSENVTNVEKIARTVQSDPAATAGVHQLVYYISGVGAGSYEADRLLGGAFGFGLFHNVIACYRFLAQNYAPGDEVFILGFSRGAYTARSVAGMLASVGLLTKVALVEERLPEAVHLYQRTAMPAGELGESVDEFRHDHCNDVEVTFLGVFDTVGALGVPGFEKETPRFHSVQLSDQVRCARQALAIDEPRLKFEPTLWEAPPTGVPHPVTADPRVKQVWFEGAHSDVGGGYAETGLSDTALLWMAREAHAAGLVFDAELLATYVASGCDPIRHDPLNLGYRVDNEVLEVKEHLAPHHGEPRFVDGLRVLTNERALSVRVASSAVAHFQEGGYAPANLAALAERTGGFAGIVEDVVRLPEAGLDISELGRPVGQDTGAAPAPAPGGIAVERICQVKIPVSDVQASARWYVGLLGLRLVREFVEDGEVVGAVLADQRGGDFVLSVRDRERIPGRPAMPGFDLLSLRVADVDALHVVLQRCAEVGAAHGEIVDRGPDGHHLDVTDPDGTNVRFLTHGSPDGPAFAGVVFMPDAPPAFYDQPRLAL
jgi:catechol 2,3-dioxygenase-like lactoylglutathione lyase family enzyme